MNELPVRALGEIVADRPPGRLPDLRPLFGRWARLEAVSAARHGPDLYDSFKDADPEGSLWTYMGYGPFADYAAFHQWLLQKEAARDPWFYAFVRRDTGRAAGMGAYLRCDAPNGVIEIGHIWMSPGLQKTREASESIFLMIRHAFDELGVRRLEWKCDALNAPSRRAAERFGFAFEGVFRQHMIVKGRNRDTAWYAIIDKEWPAIRAAFKAWLQDDNFDGEGRQRRKLAVR
jgi:RimJ/RimL family protein N-acetyltransferase